MSRTLQRVLPAHFIGGTMAAGVPPDLVRDAVAAEARPGKRVVCACLSCFLYARATPTARSSRDTASCTLPLHLSHCACGARHRCCHVLLHCAHSVHALSAATTHFESSCMLSRSTAVALLGVVPARDP